MNIQRAYLCAFLGTAIVLFLIPIAESVSYDFEIIAEILAGSSALGTILSIILACIAFQEVTKRAVNIAAFWAAALPFVIGGLWWLVNVQPNVHGVSFPVFFLYLLVSELAALSFAITAAIRKRA